MKNIRYYLMSAVMLGLSVPAMAQNDSKAAIDQVNKILTSTASADEKAEQVKTIFKANKKNAEVLVGIGRAYLDVKDTLNANKYVQLAMQRDRKYAPAYVLAGDIEVTEGVFVERDHYFRTLPCLQEHFGESLEFLSGTQNS